jgi:hypothetical protein
MTADPQNPETATSQEGAGADEAFPEIPELEVDEDIAPRPEEEIADSERAVPDVRDHSELTGDATAV